MSLNVRKTSGIKKWKLWVISLKVRTSIEIFKMLFDIWMKRAQKVFCSREASTWNWSILLLRMWLKTKLMHKLRRWSQFLTKILIKQLMSTVFLLEAVKKNRVRPVADSNNLMYRVQIKKYNKTFSLNSLA